MTITAADLYLSQQRYIAVMSEDAARMRIWQTVLEAGRHCHGCEHLSRACGPHHIDRHCLAPSYRECPGVSV